MSPSLRHKAGCSCSCWGCADREWVGKSSIRNSVCDMEGRAGQRSTCCPNHPCTLVGWTRCCGGAWLSCATRNWGKGMCCSALDCRQGSELYAVLPWM